MEQEVRNLEQLLDRVENAANAGQEISIGAVMEAVGTRSFGPLLLIAGLVLFSPLSGIPGLPTTMSLFVLLIAGQLILCKRHFWLPQWLLNRSIDRKKFCKAVGALWRPARFIDRLIKPRLKFMTHSLGTRAIALFCILISLGTPAMEVVPFSASSAGAAITAFGLSLIAEDGLLALLALLIAAGTCGVIIYGIF